MATFKVMTDIFKGNSFRQAFSVWIQSNEKTDIVTNQEVYYPPLQVYGSACLIQSSDRPTAFNSGSCLFLF